MIAEVTRINVPVEGGGAPPEEVNKLADEAAYQGWAARRSELRAEAEELGGRAEPSQLYEVTYRS
jgi:hypothetical protein